MPRCGGGSEMTEAGSAALWEPRKRPGGERQEGTASDHRKTERVDSPIYLRAKFVGTTHISMSISDFLDTGFDGFVNGGAGRGAELRGVEARAGRIDGNNEERSSKTEGCRWGGILWA